MSDPSTTETDVSLPEAVPPSQPWSSLRQSDEHTVQALCDSVEQMVVSRMMQQDRVRRKSTPQGNTKKELLEWSNELSIMLDLHLAQITSNLHEATKQKQRIESGEGEGSATIALLKEKQTRWKTIGESATGFDKILLTSFGEKAGQKQGERIPTPFSKLCAKMATENDYVPGEVIDEAERISWTVLKAIGKDDTPVKFKL